MLPPGPLAPYEGRSRRSFHASSTGIRRASGSRRVPSWLVPVFSGRPAVSTWLVYINLGGMLLPPQVQVRRVGGGTVACQASGL